MADARTALGPLAQAACGWPGRKLVNLAVTGTNGKTTVAHLIRAVLASAEHRPALLGTVGHDVGDAPRDAACTTPGPVELAELMAEAVDAGRTHLVMEVSSHALDQRRTAGVDFAAAVFTNLSGDHLDYHGTMDAYAAAKARLFAGLGPDATAVLPRDEPWAGRVAADTSARRLWYGLKGPADLAGRIEHMDASGTDLALRWDGRAWPVHTRLIGEHNVRNVLAAAAAALAVGVGPEALAAALADVSRVRGRLERIESEAGFDVFVDYAHTDDALANVLSALRPLAAGRVLLVFGCGGDRDRTKRPRMACAAEAGADAVFLTSDNPRMEDPAAILAEVAAGFTPAGRRRVAVEPDRRAAIAAALDAAGDGDVVLIAGKGHESYQILGRRRVHFDDAETAGELLAARGARA